MSWLSKVVEDSVDWIDEQVDLTKALIRPILRNTIKRIRVVWQARANQYLNEAEDKVREEAVALVRAHFPELAGIPDMKIEKLVSEIYWKHLGYIAEKWDADWIIDTE